MSSLSAGEHLPPAGGQRRRSANDRVLQELRERNWTDQDIATFNIHDPAYPPQEIQLFPDQGDHSDDTLRNYIQAVVQDGLLHSAPGPALRMVSFDMEWTTDHRARRARPSSLIQICGQKKTLIIQLVHVRPPLWGNLMLPTPVAEFLRDPGIVKFGVGISGDATKLLQDRLTDEFGNQVYLDSYLEIYDVAQLVDPTARHELPQGGYSLQRFVARYLNQFFSKTKKTTCSNWEAPMLSLTQIAYAASDVISAMRVFQELEKMPGYHYEFVPPIKHAQ